MSPGGMLLATLGGSGGGGGGWGGGCGGGGGWSGGSLARVRNHLRDVLQQRLNARCKALSRHNIRIITRGVETNLATSPAPPFDSSVSGRGLHSSTFQLNLSRS